MAADLKALAAYNQYLRRLDARALLDYYGAQRTTEQINRDGSTEIIHSCLLDRVHPHHSNGDVNPSAACNIDKKKYVCYSLGWGGDLLYFIKVMEGKEELREALGFAGNFLTEAVVPAEQLSRELERVFDHEDYAVTLPSYDESVLNPWTEGHPYWNERGITTATLEELRLGYDPTTHRLVFPHFVDGKLVGWVKRAIPGETPSPIPKYKNSPGLPKNETLYAHDLADPSGQILVVESPMSVAKAYSLGMANVVATFGAKVSRAQITLLRKHSRVIVWFDSDEAGRKGELRLLDGLYRHTEVLRVRPGVRDLGDFNDSQEVVRHVAQRMESAVFRLAEEDLARRFRR